LASEINARGGGRRFDMGGPVSSSSRPAMVANSLSTNSGSGNALVDMKKSEMLLEQLVVNTGISAAKPVLSTQRIRDEIQTLNEVERDAQF
jgi:hypothetical protein